MNFGQSNTEIGRKMADGRLLFLALHIHMGGGGNRNYSSLKQLGHHLVYWVTQHKGLLHLEGLTEVT